MTPDRPSDHAQREAAVADLDRNVVVLAGAGTGKTKLLIDRLAALILGKEIPVDRIVALTFTKKAAEEMRERLEARLRAVAAGNAEALEDIAARFSQGPERWSQLARVALDDIPKAQIGTIHGFAGHLLRLYPLQAGVDPAFREDEGGRFEAVFEREWLLWLASELGDQAPRRELWHRALRRGPLSDLKQLAQALVSPMTDESAWTSKGETLSLAARCVQDVSRLRERFPESPLARSFNPAVAALEVLFRDAAKGETIAPERVEAIEAVKSPPKDWKEADDDLKRLKKIATALAAVDEAAIAEAVEVVRPLARRVRQELARAGAVSFDGLLVSARNLLRDYPDVRAALKQRFETFLVDEFQDTDPLQGEILFYLAEAPGAEAGTWRAVTLGPGRLFVVGDPKQSIYRFRGADIAAFEAFESAMRKQGALPVALSTNFRSVPAILDLSNALFPLVMIERQYRQPAYAPLVAARTEAAASRPVVSFLRLRSASEEALSAEEGRDAEGEAIAARVAAAVSSGDWRYGEVALLFRTANAFRPYIEAFRRRGIPYLAEGEKSFYRTPEVTDFFNLACAVADSDDALALAGVLRSPVGGLTDPELLKLADAGGLTYRRTPLFFPETVGPLFQTLRELSAAASALPVPELLERLVERTRFLELIAAGPGADQAYANIMKAIDLSREWSEEAPLTLASFLRHFARSRDDQRDEGENPLADANVDAVRLLTIHKAKGLEFPVVFLPNTNARLMDRASEEVLVRDWRTGLVGLRLPKTGVQSSAMVVVEEEIAEREKAEEVRVFYVAATRARNEMIVVGSEAESRGPVAGYLKTAGLWPVAETAEARVGGVALPVEHVRFSGIQWGQDARNGRAPLPSVWEPTAAAEALRRRRAESVEASVSRLFQSPSTVLNEGEKVRRIDDDSPLPVRRAVDVGHLCHKVLEEWNFDLPPARSPAAVNKGLINAARQLELLTTDLERPALINEAKDILLGFFSSEAYERLRKARFHGREIPFLYAGEATAAGTSVMRGVMDALVEIDGRLVIADYKTNRVDADTQAQVVDHYRPQGTIYQEAVRRALGREADFALVFLRTGEIVTVPPRP